jgi:hypothetical protein
MSEQRRQRRQEREEKPAANPKSQKKIFIWGGVLLLAVLAYGGWWEYTNHRYDAFAKCLTSKQAKMYGLYWCPHCAEQKAMFGKAFQYVSYVECGIKGSHEMAPACQAAGVKLFPSWQFGTSPPIEGVFPMEELSDKTGCILP